MSRRRSSARPLIYALLIAASAVFLVPLIWLVSTSLKPIEQAMALPPTLLPRAHFALISDVRSEVTIDYAIKQPGVVADVIGGSAPGGRIFLTPEEAAVRTTGLTNVHAVSAGWIHVTRKEKGSPAPANLAAWDILPPDQIESRIRFRWENYPEALASLGGNPPAADSAAPATGPGFWVFAGNTLIVCLLGVVGTVLSNAIVAYGFARLRWRGRDAFFAITLASMMVPFPVLMVPLYGVFKELGWIGTLLPLWVPAWFGSAFNIFLMRQFFRALPEELSEAARIDGCSEWTIFWRVILPLSTPVLATAALLHFLHAWNDFLGPLLYLTRKETFTLSLALQSYQSQQGGVQWHYLMAASTVTILPVIVLFFFAQRTFIQGIATTGSKG